MPELTDPDDDGILEFTQTVEDVDGDSLSITGELDQIDGTTQSGSDRNPSWFSFTTSSSLSGGTRVVDVNVEIEKSELGEAGTTYTFILEAYDGESSSTCTFTLTVYKDVRFQGSRLYIQDQNREEIVQYSVSSRFDTSVLTLDKTYGVNNASPRGFYIAPDGKKMFHTDSRDEEIYKHELSTAWDIGTASQVQSFRDATNLNYPDALFFKDDGMRFYAKPSGQDGIAQFDLSTAWDLSTVTYVNTTNMNNRDVQGIFITEDGKKVFICGRGSEVLEKYTLGTAWDMATRSLDQSVTPTDDVQHGIDLNNDGTRIYYNNDSTYNVTVEEEMTTAYDLTTLSLINRFTPSDTGRNPWGTKWGGP